MRELLRKLWTSPSAALGALGALGVLATKLTAGGHLTSQDIVEVLAPLGVGVSAKGRR